MSCELIAVSFIRYTVRLGSLRALPSTRSFDLDAQLNEWIQVTGNSARRTGRVRHEHDRHPLWRGHDCRGLRDDVSRRGAPGRGPGNARSYLSEGKSGADPGNRADARP